MICESIKEYIELIDKNISPELIKFADDKMCDELINYCKVNGENDPKLYLIVRLIYIYDSKRKNDAEAKKWLDFAAEKGSADALFLLGLLNEGKNDSKAISYYEKASKQNDNKASVNLGLMYFYGKGVEKDCLKAMSYFVRAAENGDAKALENIAKLYETDPNVVGNNPSDIEYWYRRIAEKGNDHYQVLLGDYYFDHDDLFLAKEWYERALELGNIDAKIRLEKINHSK